jgi:hypothetical protein
MQVTSAKKGQLLQILVNRRISLHQKDIYNILEGFDDNKVHLTETMHFFLKTTEKHFSSKRTVLPFPSLKECILRKTK